MIAGFGARLAQYQGESFAMKVHYLGEDSGGRSYFEDRQITFSDGDFAPPAPPMGISDPTQASRVLYLSLQPGWRDANHRSPHHQIAYCLSGILRVTAGSGEVRDVAPGGIFEMADLTGEGHASEVVGDEPVRLAVVQFD